MKVEKCSVPLETAKVVKETHPLKYADIIQIEGVYEPKCSPDVRIVVVRHGDWKVPPAVLFYSARFSDVEPAAPFWSRDEDASFRATGERVCFELRAA